VGGEIGKGAFASLSHRQAVRLSLFLFAGTKFAVGARAAATTGTGTMPGMQDIKGEDEQIRETVRQSLPALHTGHAANDALLPQA
jgi:hypothetical protein